MTNKKRGDTKEPYVSTDKIDRKWIDVNIPCKVACPIMTDIPGYIDAIMRGDYKTAYLINRLDNVLPGSLGRVCNRPCEEVCRHGRDGLGDPVSICFLKRSAADYGLEPLKPDITPNGKSVCIIGAGPAGLTAANDLALLGYKVTVLEQFKEAGGMLRYGIPQFRLPYDVVAADVKSVTDLGVEIKTGVRPDGTSIEKLRKEFDAVLLAGGCSLPKKLNLPGLESKGVYWGLDFMEEANEETLSACGQKVVVIGGGFTAVDCTRMSLRMGAKQVSLAYRRTKDDMYVTENELEAMEAEGVALHFLVSPLEIESKDGHTTGIHFIRNAIDNETRKVHAIEDSRFLLEADTVIFAIGQKAEDQLAPGGSGENEGNFFIAGDFRNGASTVIEAAADGRKTARRIHRFLSPGKTFKETIKIEEVQDTRRIRDYDFIPRQRMDETPLQERKEKNKEVETGYSREKSVEEARRCYLCHFNFQIDIKRCIYCLACIDVMPVDCIKMAKDVREKEDGTLEYIATDRWDEVRAITIDNDKCIRCGNCVRACPVDCISISKYTLDTTAETAPQASEKKKARHEKQNEENYHA